MTWTLSCEKNNASRPDGKVFSFSMYGMTNSVLVGSSIETQLFVLLTLNRSTKFFVY